MHEEALEVLPELLDAARDRAAAARRTQRRRLDRADLRRTSPRRPRSSRSRPHVFVEDMCLAEIRQTKQTFETTDLRERMARHHRDPDAAFYGWNDVWLHPEFPRVEHRRRARRASRAPLLLIQGDARPVRDDGSARLDRAARQGPGHARPPRLPALAADRAARPDRRGDRGVYERPAAFRYLATASGANTAMITSDHTTAPHTLLPAGAPSHSERIASTTYRERVDHRE